MGSTDGFGVAGQVQGHLTAIADAMSGLCDMDMTGLADGELTDTMRRLETSLRQASAVGHKLIVETVERSLPGKLGHKTVKNHHNSVLRNTPAHA
ncbi:HNH endonuclease, partial [Rhodococcus sp. NPDC058514]